MERANSDQLGSIKILIQWIKFNVLIRINDSSVFILWINSPFSLHFPLACSIVHSSLMLRQIQPPISTT